jgi:hypothetical protein
LREFEIERFRAKWNPVRVKKTRQKKSVSNDAAAKVKGKRPAKAGLFYFAQIARFGTAADVVA